MAASEDYAEQATAAQREREELERRFAEEDHGDGGHPPDENDLIQVG